MEYQMYTDGGARGNPGPAGIGIAIYEDDNLIVELGIYIGRATNNDAEYQALIEGLKECIVRGIKSVKCFLDSQLVVRQLQGQYKVKNDKIKNYFMMIKNLENSFTKVEYEHIPREKNKIADSLVNKVLDASISG